MNKAKLDLSGFFGTDEWHRHWLGKMLYTDGVKYFAEEAGGGAYWFLDIIATEVLPLQEKEEFIHIAMTVNDGKALITAGDGNGNKLWQRALDFTDCPEGTWEFYLTDNVLLLPSEY